MKSQEPPNLAAMINIEQTPVGFRAQAENWMRARVPTRTHCDVGRCLGASAASSKVE
jgi:hypothetical protein